MNLFPFEFLQISIAITMFTVTSYVDYKSRMVDDKIWLIFGSIGGILTGIWLYQTPNNLNFVLVQIGVCIAVAIVMFKIFGTADALGLVALSIILPSVGPFPLLPLLVLALAAVLVLFYSLISNIRYNFKNAMSGVLFSDIDEPLIKKIGAFFLIHKKLKNEKFVFPGIQLIEGKTKFLFRHDPNTQEFEKNDSYVIAALPMMPFFLGSLTILIFVNLFLS